MNALQRRKRQKSRQKLTEWISTAITFFSLAGIIYVVSLLGVAIFAPGVFGPLYLKYLPTGEVTATVVDRHLTKWEKGVDNTLVLSYVLPQSSKPITREEDVSDEVYASATEGSTVALKYLRWSPSILCIEGDDHDVGWLALIIVMIPASIALAVLAILSLGDLEVAIWGFHPPEPAAPTLVESTAAGRKRKKWFGGKQPDDE